MSILRNNSEIAVSNTINLDSSSGETLVQSAGMSQLLHVWKLSADHLQTSWHQFLRCLQTR